MAERKKPYRRPVNALALYIGRVAMGRRVHRDSVGGRQPGEEGPCGDGARQGETEDIDLSTIAKFARFYDSDTAPIRLFDGNQTFVDYWLRPFEDRLRYVQAPGTACYDESTRTLYLNHGIVISSDNLLVTLQTLITIGGPLFVMIQQLVTGRSTLFGTRP
jgi:hypothetical protein